MTPAPDLSLLLAAVIDRGASDLHLQVGQTPMLRVSGEMTPYECPILTPEHTQEITTSVLPPHMLERLEREGGADFAIPFGEDARFRVSILKAKKNYGLVFRLIPSRLIPMDQIGLPPRI